MKEKNYIIISISSFLLAIFLIALMQSMSMYIEIQAILATLIITFGCMAFLIPIARINVLSGYQLIQ